MTSRRTPFWQTAWTAAASLLMLGHACGATNAHDAPQGSDLAWQRLLDFRFVQAVAVSPVDSRVVYAGTNDHPYHDDYVPEGVLKNTDGGATWRHENAGLSHRSIHSLSVSPHDPSRLHLATGGNGVFLGKDSNSRSR